MPLASRCGYQGGRAGPGPAPSHNRRSVGVKGPRFNPAAQRASSFARQSVGPNASIPYSVPTHSQPPQDGAARNPTPVQEDLNLPPIPNLVAFHKRHGEEGLRNVLDNFPLDIYIDGIDNLHAQVSRIQRQCNRMEFALVTWQSYMQAVLDYLDHQHSGDAQAVVSSEPPPNLEHQQFTDEYRYTDTAAPPVAAHRSQMDFPYITADKAHIHVPRLNQAGSILASDPGFVDLMPSNLPASLSNLPPGLPRAPTTFDVKQQHHHPAAHPPAPHANVLSEHEKQQHSRVSVVPIGGSHTQPNNPTRLSSPQDSPDEFLLPFENSTDRLQVAIERMRELARKTTVEESVVAQPTESEEIPVELDQELERDSIVHRAAHSQPSEKYYLQEIRSRSSGSAADIENMPPAAHQQQHIKPPQESHTQSPNKPQREGRGQRSQASMSVEYRESQQPQYRASQDTNSCVESYRGELCREPTVSGQSNTPFQVELGKGEAPPQGRVPEDLGASLASNDSHYVFPTRVQMHRQQRPLTVPSLPMLATDNMESAWLRGENTMGEFYPK